jgi:hypothetical protein
MNAQIEDSRKVWRRAWVEECERKGLEITYPRPVDAMRTIVRDTVPRLKGTHFCDMTAEDYEVLYRAAAALPFIDMKPKKKMLFRRITK